MGLLSGSALLIGAAAGWFAPLPRRLIAAIMGFGAGVLISALSFDLMDEAWQRSHDAGSGFAPVAAGFIGGAALFTLCNVALGLWGARHRKRSSPKHRALDTSQSPQNGGALRFGRAARRNPGIDRDRNQPARRPWRRHGGGRRDLPLEPARRPVQRRGHEGRGTKVGFVFLLWAGIALVSGLAALLGYLPSPAHRPGWSRPSRPSPPARSSP